MSYPSDQRRANQDFKRRYAAMSEKEREELHKDSDKLGCVIGFIVLIFTAIGIIIKALFGDS